VAHEAPQFRWGPSGASRVAPPPRSNGKTRGVTDREPDDSGQFTLVDAAALSPAETLVRLASSTAGLSASEVVARQRRYGPNALGTHRVRGLSVLFRQLRNPILILLLLAALVSALTGGGTNAAIIAAIVGLSVGLSFFNEYRAEVAMSALRAKIHLDAEVRRHGETSQVPVTELVPGDIVALRVGALVPADIRLLDVDELECDEAVLTGESMPVVKSAEATTDREPLDQPGCAFMGTVVHEGSATGVVVGTGARTAFGAIAAGLAEKQGQTSFEVGLSKFSRFLFTVAALLTVFIFAINLILARPVIDALLFSLAIAVGIAPEMMPAIVTVSLSAGSKALVEKKVLVKRLVAIEDLGNIEILFTDKTGTLTDGVIAFEQSLDAVGRPDDRSLVLRRRSRTASPSVAMPSIRPCGWGSRPPSSAAPLATSWPRSRASSESAPFRSTTSARWPRCSRLVPPSSESSSPRAPPRRFSRGAWDSPTRPTQCSIDCSPRARGSSPSPRGPVRTSSTSTSRANSH
jgi:Mg2+-importing ATPase